MKQWLSKDGEVEGNKNKVDKTWEQDMEGEKNKVDKRWEQDRVVGKKKKAENITRKKNCWINDKLRKLNWIYRNQIICVDDKIAYYILLTSNFVRN